jgi:hypothetical protein
MYPISCIVSMFLKCLCIYAPDPLDAARASSPMKKSRSSVPLFIERWPPCPAPPVRYDGLFATAGLPDPEPPLPVAGPFVAIAVGKTKEGESLPAKPRVRLSASSRGIGMLQRTNQVWRSRYRCKIELAFWYLGCLMPPSKEGNSLRRVEPTCP